MEKEKNEQSAINGNGGNKTRRIMIFALIVFVVAASFIGIVYLDAISKRVYVEKSEIDASSIALSSKSGGVLEELYTKTGDEISAGEVVARVGNELVKSKDAGLVISRQDEVGKYFNPGEEIVTMIRPSDLRVVGKLEEDKGLKDVKVGQRVFFEVDAFGTKQYEGVIDEVSPTSRPSDVVFNISDQRQENVFNVKARFNFSEYSELKNGMSAKMWIYK
ncbi:MAG: HlyD family secretion protein [Parcubacteria group bacterium]|jgi:multidrug resistance efflux pump